MDYLAGIIFDHSMNKDKGVVLTNDNFLIMQYNGTFFDPESKDESRF